jgi:hypothetical protein
VTVRKEDMEAMKEVFHLDDLMKVGLSPNGGCASFLIILYSILRGGFPRMLII